MQAGNVYRVRTNAANQFTGALATGAAAAATLDMFENPSTFSGDKMGLGAGKHLRCRLREIRVISAQALDWEIWLFAASPFGGNVIGAEKLVGQFQFVAANGLQAAGDSFFYYYASKLDCAFENLDVDANGNLAQTGKIYVRLINRNAIAKIAGAGGAIEIEFAFEILQGR